MFGRAGDLINRLLDRRIQAFPERRHLNIEPVAILERGRSSFRRHWHI